MNPAAHCGGVAGHVAGTALKAATAAGTTAATVGTDLTNQMGVGHHTYQPDTTPRRAGTPALMPLIEIPQSWLSKFLTLGGCQCSG